MPQYKLIYFNVKGRAELARYLFALAGQEYIDERLEREKWLEIKPTTIWGQIPVLEVDGKQICQSGAIVRFLARELGFMGKNKDEEVYVDMLMGCMDDIVEPLASMFFEKDEAKRAELMKDHQSKFPDFLKRLEGFLCDNKGGNGWFVGDSVTVADGKVHLGFDFLQILYPNALDNFPKLKEHRKRFEELPQIADWMAKRPVTDH